MNNNELIKHLIDNRIFTVDMDTGNIIGKRGRTIGSVNNQGRLRVGYKLDGKYRKLYAHRIIAYCKFGDELFNYETVDHIDANPLNNHPDNLQLMPLSHNSTKALTKDYPMVGENNRNCKLTVQDIVEIKNNKVENNKQLAKKYGVTHQMISRIRLGYNWSHI